MAAGFDRVPVEVLGETFTVRGDPSGGEVQKVHDYLQEQIAALLERYPYLSEKKLAVLVAFNLADELLRVQADYKDLISIIDGSR